MKSVVECTSSCCSARCQNGFCWWQKVFSLLCCKGLNRASLMLDGDDDDRNSPQKCYDTPCEPAFKKVGRALTSLLSKQHMLRAELHSTNGTKATASLRTTKAGGELPLAWAWYVSIRVQNKSYTFTFLSFPSFFLSVPSCSSNLQIQTPRVSKNRSFSTGRLFIVGPVPKYRDCFWLLGN